MVHIAGATPPLPKTSRRTQRGRSVVRLRRIFRDQRGSQITDNLGLIVIGIVAIVAIGGLISGLDTTLFKWVTTQLGLG
jgi:hypothetical protein